MQHMCNHINIDVFFFWGGEQCMCFLSLGGESEIGDSLNILCALCKPLSFKHHGAICAIIFV